MMISTIQNKAEKGDTHLEEVQGKLSKEVAFELRYERSERMSQEGSEGIAFQAGRTADSTAWRQE